MTPYSRTLRSIFLAFILISESVLVHAADYTVTDLGLGVANDINSSGKVVGTGPQGGFYFDGTNRLELEFEIKSHTDAGDPPLTEHVYPTQGAAPVGRDYVRAAIAINDAGRIVGVTDGKNNHPWGWLRLFIYDGTGVATGYFPVGQEMGLNPRGDVVFGSSDSGYGLMFPEPRGKAEPLQLALWVASAINDSGTVVGAVSSAAILSNGSVTPLNLDHLVPAPGSRDTRESLACSINEAGVVVGWVKMTTWFLEPWGKAFVHANGVTTDLGSLGGPLQAAYDINNNGWIVGSSDFAAQTPHAFIYRDGQMKDLNALIAGNGWVLTSANAINDAGQIVGTGTFEGQTRAFLLTPINPGSPQPPSIVNHPVGGTFALGAGTTLSVTANGTAPFSFQWQKDGVDLLTETNATLVLGNLQGTNSGSYRVKLSNSAGVANSNPAVITVLDPKLAVANCALVTVTGAVGGQYRIDYVNWAEATDWKPVATITLTNASQVYVDFESATNHPRYYRAVRLPLVLGEPGNTNRP